MNYVFECLMKAEPNFDSEFHTNICLFLEQLYGRIPEDSIKKEQWIKDKLANVWITQCRLCSSIKEQAQCGHCMDLYLKEQLKLFPKAIKVGFGTKTWRQLDKIKKELNKESDEEFDYIKCYSFSPLGTRKKGAMDKWNEAIRKIKCNRDQLRKN